MHIVRICKEFHFEGAHALVGYDGKCRHLHGHSYRLLVSLTGKPNSQLCCPKNGMVLDFGDLKHLVEDLIINDYDHALLLRKDAPLATEIANTYQKVILLDFQPTCEMLTLHFAQLLQAKLPENIQLHSIRLYETATAYVEWVNNQETEQQ